MSSANRFDSPVAQFTDNPLTRNWPEPAALDALFRYCVRRFLGHCLANPRTWLTSGDLRGLLAELLREELPRHGLPAYSVHLDYVPSELVKQEPAKPLRHSIPLEFALLIPDTIQRDQNGRCDAVLALGATVRLGFTPVTAIQEEIARLAALQERLHGALFYFVIVGYQDSQDSIETATKEAEKSGITVLSDNYTGLEEPVRQEKLL